MRLLSATVRNYRLHRETTVEFAADLTLIGGPNESGKSTLVEAIHRGLFLRARTGGEVQRSMVSRLVVGAPEVEVRFGCGDAVWRVIKRFSGASGSTQLQREGGETLHDAEAEERLHQLLRVEEVGSGRGIAERLLQQWSHLWVWQGKSADDPTLCGRSEHPELIQKLQQIGGAAAMVSSADDAAARHFAARRDELFLQSGKARKGSPLEKAEAEQEAAEAELERARKRVADREKAVRDYEAAVAALASLEEVRGQLRQQRLENDAALEEIRTLREQERLQSAATAQASTDLKKAEEADQQIRALIAEEASLRQKIAPLQESQEKRLHEQSTLLRGAETINQSLSAIRESIRRGRREQEWLRACMRRAAAEEKRQQTASLHRKVDEARERERTLKAELAALSSISEEDLTRLRKLETARSRAEAKLEAMAAGIEILEADAPVLLNGRELSTGAREVLTTEAELASGGLRLRLTPGGGEDLATARQSLERARSDLRQQLSDAGVKSLEEAVGVVSRRGLLQQDIAKEQATLRHLEADSIGERLRQSQEEVEAAEAELERRASELTETERAPAEPETCRARLDELAALSEKMETDERRLESELQATEKKRKSVERELQQNRDALLAAQQQADDRKSRLEVLVSQQGNDAERAARLGRLRQRADESQALLDATRQSLRKLDPEARERGKTRIERAQEQNEQNLRGAEAARAVAQAELQSDGSENPHAALAEAENRFAEARAARGHVQRQAEAIRLLDSLFVEAQQAMSESFSRPLADRITGYLRTIFGPGARAEVHMEKNELTGIRLTRGNLGEDAFGELSGGAREQLAAAVRLAMAELLAADHNGCLPIVFDDAFSASDPDRVQAVQQMLDHAAARGLQVIILSCNPADYGGLGANTILLKD